MLSAEPVRVQNEVNTVAAESVMGQKELNTVAAEPVRGQKELNTVSDEPVREQNEVNLAANEPVRVQNEVGLVANEPVIGEFITCQSYNYSCCGCNAAVAVPAHLYQPCCSPWVDAGPMRNGKAKKDAEGEQAWSGIAEDPSGV